MAKFDWDQFEDSKKDEESFNWDNFDDEENSHDFLPYVSNVAKGLGKAASAVGSAIAHPIDTIGEAGEYAYDLASDPVGTAIGGMEGASRVVRSVPILGPMVEDAAAGIHGNLSRLGADYDKIVGKEDAEDPQAAYDRGVNSYKRALKDLDDQHAIEHPLVHTIQTIAGQANPLGINPATQAIDTYIRSRQTNNIKDSLKDARNTALLGFATDKLGGAVLSPNKAAQASKAAAKGVSDVARATSEGVVDAAKNPHLVDAALMMHGIPPVVAPIKTISTTRSALKDIKEMDEVAEKMIGPGPRTFSSEAEITDALLRDDPLSNQAKEWVANKSSSIGAGVKKDLYQSLLDQPSDVVTAARDFNKKAAADQVAPLKVEMQNAFNEARRMKMEQYKQKAIKEFNEGQGDLNPVIDKISKAYQQASEFKDTKPATGILSDAFDIIQTGKGAERYGLTPGNWQEMNGTERFNRLSAVREFLDSRIDYDAFKGPRPVRSITPVERELLAVRRSVDENLKSASDAKVQSDSLYKKTKDLEDRFFKLITDKDGVDEVSLSKIFGDNDKATKFGKFRDEFREFVDKEDLPAELKDSAGMFIAQIDEARKLAFWQRQMEQLKKDQTGVSGHALTRVKTITDKDSLLQEALKDPQGFMGSKVEFLNRNKDFNQLSKKERIERILKWNKARKAGLKNPNPGNDQ